MNVPRIRAVATQQGIKLTRQIVVVVWQRETGTQRDRQEVRGTDR